MKTELLLLVFFYTLLSSCESNNPMDISNEICNCLKEQYVGAKDIIQAERIKIGENCLLDNLNQQAHELKLSQDALENNDRIKKSDLLVKISNETMKSLKSKCMYFRTFTNDKLNHLKKEIRN